MPFLNEVLVANGTTTLGRIVWAKAVLDIILNDHVLTMAVNAGGTGYVVGETFDLTTGTAVGAFNARGVVTAESGGIVSAVKIVSAGAYTADPTLSGGATSNASAAGNDDLTIDVTMQTALWTLDRDTYTNDTTDFEFLCTSVKSVNPATIGMDTNTSGGNDAVRLTVSSGYDSGSTIEAQPDGSPMTQMYMAVPAQNPELFLSTTERRVNLVARDGNNVQYGGFGLFIPLTDAAASYPFPGLVHAQATTIRAMSESLLTNGLGGNNCGILHVGTYTTVFPAARYRDNLSTAWKTISYSATNANVDAAIWPDIGAADTNLSYTHAPKLNGFETNPMAQNTGHGKLVDDASGWFTDPIADADGTQGVSNLGIGSQMSLVCTAHIIANQVGDVQVVGIVDGFENVHGVGLTAFEELQSHNQASRYIVFPDTNTSNIPDWVAMEII